MIIGVTIKLSQCKDLNEELEESINSYFDILIIAGVGDKGNKDMGGGVGGRSC